MFRKRRATRYRPTVAALLIILGFGVARAEGSGPGEDRAPTDLPAALGSRVGLAVRHAGKVCFSIQNAHLAVQAHIALVTPTYPQSIATAVIAGSGSGCPGANDPNMTGYELAIVHGKVADNLVLIGIAGPARLSLRDGQRIEGDLAHNGKRQTFRSCTSADGVHFTIWQGSRRLWHAYYYIGQDLEPTCTDKDVAE